MFDRDIASTALLSLHTGRRDIGDRPIRAYEFYRALKDADEMRALFSAIRLRHFRWAPRRPLLASARQASAWVRFRKLR